MPMIDRTERERTGPTDDVGDEGGSPGEIELKRRNEVTHGSEATSTIESEPAAEEERDRQLTRDDRPRPESA